MQGINFPAISWCHQTLIVMASCVSSSTKRISTVSACRMEKDNKVKRDGIPSSRLILLTSGKTSAESNWLYINHTLQPSYTPAHPCSANQVALFLQALDCKTSIEFERFQKSIWLRKQDASWNMKHMNETFGFPRYEDVSLLWKAALMVPRVLFTVLT